AVFGCQDEIGFVAQTIIASTIAFMVASFGTMETFNPAFFMARSVTGPMAASAAGFRRDIASSPIISMKLVNVAALVKVATEIRPSCRKRLSLLPCFSGLTVR